jgi:hypothetical protein
MTTTWLATPTAVIMLAITSAIRATVCRIFQQPDDRIETEGQNK